MDADFNPLLIVSCGSFIRVYPCASVVRLSLCPSVEYTIGTKEQSLLVSRLETTFRSMSSVFDYPNRSACVPVRSNITSCLVLL